MMNRTKNHIIPENKNHIIPENKNYLGRARRMLEKYAYKPNTIKIYLAALTRISKHFFPKQFPDITSKELNTFLEDSLEIRSYSAIGNDVSAIRLLYNEVLKSPRAVTRLIEPV